ncbi:MAG: phenylalanine--tRNA ligase subunit alpha [Nitrososphaerota archaeon]|nr:phenylalanine--tRNA ligase subunit alpha [Nitrososphaerota archaeon]
MTESSPLHPIEKTILGSLRVSTDSRIGLDELVSTSNLSIDQVRRGVEWLKAKDLIQTDQKEVTTYSLGPEGQTVLKVGLPERKLVNLIKSLSNTEVNSVAKTMGEEFAVALGKSKNNGWVRIESGALFSTPSAEGKEPEEIILQKLAEKGPVPSVEFSNDETDLINELRKRRDGYIEINSSKSLFVSLTPRGKSIATTSTDEIDAITPRILQSGEWKDKSLRALDVTSPAPTIYGGRRHPMRLFMDEVRETFVSLGFEEIFGSISQSALWNFDALFIPQEHSAREMQDTFYLSDLRANLEGFKEQIKGISNAHENGAGTGSAGWQYKWKEAEASRVVLRTHTTAVTISYLAQNKPDDARVFSIGRVFRNEKSNYKHNPEFFQIEGVMVGEKLNLRNLIYVLSKFYSKLGFSEIKFWPTYFPYTEPSLQTMAYVKDTKRWMELGGMGVFRPEVTHPLGVKNPVLAWGLSLDRLVMLRYGVSDIRQLFGANLEWLRNLQLTKV